MEKESETTDVALKPPDTLKWLHDWKNIVLLFVAFVGTPATWIFGVMVGNFIGWIFGIAVLVVCVGTTYSGPRKLDHRLSYS